MHFNIDYDSQYRKAILDCPILDLIRETFSCEDKALFFAKRRRGFRGSSRKYIITGAGHFEVPFTPELTRHIRLQYPEATIKLSEEIKKRLYPSQKIDKLVDNLSFTPKDYQEESCLAALRFNRGIIVLPTSAGKTFVAALLSETVYRTEGCRTLIIVPNIQLVEQTYKDFISYGISKDRIAKWSGDNPYSFAQTIVVNTQILTSESTNQELLKEFDLIIVDEVHKMATSTEIKKIVNKYTSPSRMYGMTGTMPEEDLKLWTLYGMFGPVVYEQKSVDLRDRKDISPVTVCALKLHPLLIPEFTAASIDDPTVGYLEEVEYILSNKFRNETVCKLVKKLENNSLVLVDRIAHGEQLAEMLEEFTDKRVYYINGSVAVDEREAVRLLMESNNDIVVVAIAKIFSTGISINNLHNVVFAHMGKARSKLIQSIGRSLRLHKSKVQAKIFDIADVCLPYGMKHFMERERIYIEEEIPLVSFDIKEKMLTNTEC